MPTASAPAALASSALAPWANTATRTLLPEPCGRTVEPRTFWSDFLASMPRLIDRSTDSLNLAVGAFFEQGDRGVEVVDLAFLDLAVDGLLAFADLCHGLLLHHIDAHAAGGTGDHQAGGVEAAGIEVFHLQLGDFRNLGAGDLADLLGVRRRPNRSRGRSPS